VNTRRPYIAPILALALFAFCSFGHAAPPATDHLVINTISTNAESASGGDVLVRIDVPDNATAADVKVTLNGADITDVFLPDASGRALVGLVGNLRNGDNDLRAETKRTKPSLNAKLSVQTFPIYGPIFAGPHQEPWICETDTSGLGPSLRVGGNSRNLPQNSA
jgi:hypothetical protein